MTLRFEQFLTEGIAQCSYLLGDAGTAAVVDPRADVDIYIARARELGLAITHVFETHIHADFQSGARELVARLGGKPQLLLSAEAGARYGFDHKPVRDGDCMEFGSVRMAARHTPGHTPEHLSYVMYEKDRDVPWGVMSGDSFFTDSVGRPDLLGKENTEELTMQLFKTIQNFYMKLDDGVLVFPCHGAGSACGPNIGDRLCTTIAYEKKYNKYTKMTDPEEFHRVMEGDAPPVPTHYTRLKKANANGPEVLFNLPRIPPLAPNEFLKLTTKSDVQLLDLRDMMAFGGGHIEGSLNIAAQPELSVWAGWLLDPGKPIALVAEKDEAISKALRLLWRTGFTNFAGYLAGGIGAWREKGMRLAHINQMTVHELRDADVIPLDVRSDQEWRGGHVPGAQHAFLGRLNDELGRLDRKNAYATYCASGFRASIAASFLKARGFDEVYNVPGSWKAWKAAGFETEKPE